MTSWRTKLLPPLLAIVFAVLLSAIALIISGADPLQAYGTMIGQMFKGSTAVDTVNLATVYYLSGLAVAIGFQMNLFNIGVEGQYRFAAVVAAIAGGAMKLPPVIHVVAILVVAIVAGMAYAAVPAILKVTRGVSEVISTIMLNAIVAGIIAFLINADQFGVQRGQQHRHPRDRAVAAGSRASRSARARCSGSCSSPRSSAAPTGSCSTARGSASSSRRPASPPPRPRPAGSTPRR